MNLIKMVLEKNANRQYRNSKRNVYNLTKIKKIIIVPINFKIKRQQMLFMRRSMTLIVMAWKVKKILFVEFTDLQW